MCKGLKLSAQTCDKFQIPDRAAAAFLLHFYLTLKLSPKKKTQLLIDKSKVQTLRVPNKEECFRAVIALRHHNQCKVSILILERT